jgi:hypothetical protein
MFGSRPADFRNGLIVERIDHVHDIIVLPPLAADEQRVQRFHYAPPSFLLTENEGDFKQCIPDRREVYFFDIMKTQWIILEVKGMNV